jgi:hypothetical protein
MHELAEEYGGAVFDTFRLMGGMRSSASWVRARLQRADHIHFTKEGYELWGDLLYNALMMDFMKAKESLPLAEVTEEQDIKHLQDSISPANTSIF